MNRSTTDLHVDPSYKIDLDISNCFGRNKLCLITKEIQYIVLILAKF